MLAKINPQWRVLSAGAPATSNDLLALARKFPNAPQDYLELVRDAQSVDLKHTNGKYIRIWSPQLCIELSDAYMILKYVPDAFPLGDNGGDSCLAYMNGELGWGLYVFDFGDIDRLTANWVAKTLTDLLLAEIGVNSPKL